MRTPLLLSAWALVASPLAHANSCDTIRAGIDAKIGASGAVGYSLAVVPADARAPGKVVGSCELGTRKIVYLPNGAAAGSASAPRVPQERILTECRDGSVRFDGDCSR